MNVAMKAARGPRAVEWAGTVYRISVGACEGGGVVGIFESTVPAMGGPPVHVHHNEDEVIYALEGDYEFWLDGETRIVPQGSCIFLPRGVPHTFRVRGDRPGRNLTILTPGGLEEFFVECAAGELKIPDDMPALTELAGRYGIEFRGPARWPD